MSDSGSSDILSARRPRAKLFHDDDDASSSPPRSPPRQESISTKKRAAPRFLGDGAGDSHDLDHLFDGLDDVPQQIDVPDARRVLSPAARDGDDPFRAQGANDDDDNIFGNGGVLGDGGDVDEVKKKRKVLARMDEARLLGPSGFPALMDNVKKFKTSGKGQETKDLNRVLSLYQLWAHQMYPKTNLRDTLATVEKLCHKRYVQRALKEYRDEVRHGKKKPTDDATNPLADEQSPLSDMDHNDAPIPPPKAAHGASQPLRNPSQGANDVSQLFADDLDEMDDFDEMDVLNELDNLAPRQNQGPSSRKAIPPPSPRRDEFDEDEEAMMAEFEAEREAQLVGGGKGKGKEVARPSSAVPTKRVVDGEEEEDYDALMAEAEIEAQLSVEPRVSAVSMSLPAPPTAPPGSSTQQQGDEADDFFGDDIDLDDAALSGLSSVEKKGRDDEAVQKAVALQEEDDGGLAAAEDALFADL